MDKQILKDYNLKNITLKCKSNYGIIYEAISEDYNKLIVKVNFDKKNYHDSCKYYTYFKNMKLCKMYENDDKNNIFNGDSHISLVQKTLMTDDMYKHFRSSYNELIQGSLCAVISPEIEGIVYPNYFDCEYDTSFIISDDSTERYSYYLDEIQTAVPIPTSKFLAIGYPMTHFKTKKNSY